MRNTVSGVKYPSCYYVQKRVTVRPKKSSECQCQRHIPHKLYQQLILQPTPCIVCTLYPILNSRQIDPTRVIRSPFRLCFLRQESTSRIIVATLNPYYWSINLSSSNRSLLHTVLPMGSSPEGPSSDMAMSPASTASMPRRVPCSGPMTEPVLDEERDRC